jgi:lysophospholipase L1-like esterase
MRILCTLAMLAAILLPQQARAEDPANPPTITECSTNQSAANDQTKPLAVFVGSSSIAKWKCLADDFPNLRVVNLGVEGSKDLPDGQMIEGVDKLVDKIIGMNPGICVLYIGENDLWRGDSPETVHDGIERITKKLGASLPDLKIVYVTIKPSVARVRITPEIVRTNLLLQADVSKDDRLRLADVYSRMVNKGQVLDGLYTEKDPLHMTALGYRIWTQVISEALQSLLQ